MSLDPPKPPSLAEIRAKTLLRVVAGLVLFVPIDMLVLELFPGAGSVTAGLAFAAVTGALAFALYRVGQRWIALGLAIGFAVMTAVTGGVCTLFKYSEYGAFAGVIYAAVVTNMAIVAGIAYAAIRAARRWR